MKKKDDSAKPRVLEPNRAQMRLIASDLESLIADDHPARAVWAYVERLDLSAFYAKIGSLEGSAGRPATDPRILLALWILATLDGVGAAREIERLCREHHAYQWICGGVSVNHHSLSDFRSFSADQLNEALTQSSAVLLSQGLVELKRVAHDGMKVRAAAGASSFRSSRRLHAMAKIAREQVERLSKEIDDDPSAGHRRREAAQKQARESRLKRIERALKQLPEINERKRSKNGKKKSRARASITDPDARVMRMTDGGYRPAFNVHLVADTVTQLIVAFDVNNLGTDSKAMVPLMDQVHQQYERRPAEWLADGGCVSHQNINHMAERNCKVYAPIKSRRSGRPRNRNRKTDTEPIKAWRKRMSSKDGKQIYKERAATSECINAQFRNNGLQRFLVRGLEKVKSVVLLHILTHNMRRIWALQPI